MNRTSPEFTMPWPLAILLLLPAITRAEVGVQAWVQRYNGPGNLDDHAYGLAVDRSNNIIATGYSIAGGGYADFLTIKYSSAGVPLWTNCYAGPGNLDNRAYAAVADSDNNVIVTGYSCSSTNLLDSDYATIKYSSAGVPLWTNRYRWPASRDNVPIAVVVDGNNDVIVAGSAATWRYPAWDHDYIIIKYSSAGMTLWTNSYNGHGNSDDFSNSLAVDSNNNVLVTGGACASSGFNECVTIKFSSAGVPLWTNRYVGPQGGSGSSVSVDGSNNVIVAGKSRGGAGDVNYVTIKYSSAGVLLWADQYHGPGVGNDLVVAMVVDRGGNALVTGISCSPSSSGTYDYATIKYSSTGVSLWTNRYHGPEIGDDFAEAIAVDGNNNVIVTGCSGFSFERGSDSDYATIKYSSAGVPLWTNRYSGPGIGNDSPAALAVDRNNNVVVTGGSIGSASGQDFATVKYVSVPSPVIANLTSLNGALHLQVADLLQPGTLVIEASTNFTGWVPVFTNNEPTDVLFYVDPDANKYPSRFYRAFQFP